MTCPSDFCNWWYETFYVANFSLTANSGGEANNINILKQTSNEKSKVWVAAEPAQSDDEKKVSDVWLASQIGVSRQTVNYWINGQRDILVSRLHEVADALNVRVRDLFDE